MLEPSGHSREGAVSPLHEITHSAGVPFCVGWRLSLRADSCTKTREYLRDAMLRKDTSLFPTITDTDRALSAYFSVNAAISAPSSISGEHSRRSLTQDRRRNGIETRNHAKGLRPARRAGTDSRATRRWPRPASGRTGSPACPPGRTHGVRRTDEGTPPHTALLKSQESAS